MVMATLMPWLKFALCLISIGAAGPALLRNADIISRLTGLSRSWIGLALLATATSLPELFTGISAVTVANAPNIAVGDLLGSCEFNLAMLVLLDAFSRKEPLYRHIDQVNILTAGFGVILIGAAGAFILLSHNAVTLARSFTRARYYCIRRRSDVGFIVAMLFKPETRLRGTIGWVSLALLVVYVFSSYAIHLTGP